MLEKLYYIWVKVAVLGSYPSSRNGKSSEKKINSINAIKALSNNTLITTLLSTNLTTWRLFKNKIKNRYKIDFKILKGWDNSSYIDQTMGTIKDLYFSYNLMLGTRRLHKK